MATTTPLAPAITPAPPIRHWRVRLGRPAQLFGEWLSPMHDDIRVDDAGLAELGDAVTEKIEVASQDGPDGR